MTNVLFLCTGNAARSVMATVVARHLAPGLGVRGAGTFSIPGLPMSQRTRQALAARGLADPNHRSRQLDHHDTDWADIIVGFEPQHMEYVRRKHPDSAAIAGSLPRLARQLRSGPPALGERLEAMGLGDQVLEPWEEVVDPAGGDQAVFDESLQEISDLVHRLVPILDASSP